jgi:NAD(P)-dependent dehydrogenase (short-subunit alcohol dehydrogenase family)
MADCSPLPLRGWALILGASSGFGAAAAVEFARAGCDIAGVHFDRRATLPSAHRTRDAVLELGRQARFYNVNAADPERMTEVLQDLQPAAGQGGVAVVLHSLAFGSLLSLEQTSVRQLQMTTDVMANSLVMWVQGLVQRSMLGQGGRVFAMTSTGASSVWACYGAVSAAKAALEAYVRQLAFELAPRGITVNAICAGVTDTPALRKIPTHQGMIDVALRKNPHHRLTVPQDVAAALVALAQPCTYWMTGNVIQIDGGEAISG